MSKEILFSEYNFRIINFLDIIKEIEVDLINDLFTHGLHDAEKVTRDIKRIYHHHVIYGICNRIIQYKGKEKAVIYFSRADAAKASLFNSEQKLNLIEDILKKVAKTLPIRIYSNCRTFKELYAILSKRCGQRDEIIANIKQYLETVDYTMFTFSKIRHFTEKNGLQFLNKDYFTALKTKQLLMT